MVSASVAARALEPAGSPRHGQLIRGSSALVVGVGITAVTSMAFWLLAARRFSPADVGRASALYTAVLFVNYATTMGLPVAAARYMSDETRTSQVLFSWALVYTTVSSALGTWIFLALMPGHSLAALWDLGTPTGVLLFFFMVAGSSLAVLVDMRAMAARRWAWVLTRFAVVGLVRLPFLWAPFVRTHPSFWLYVLVAGPPAVSGVVWMVAMRTVGASRRQFWWPLPTDARAAFRFASVNYLATLASDAPKFALPVIVAITVLPSVNAAFYVVWSVAALVFLVPLVIGQVLLVEGGKPDVHTGTQMKLGFVISLALMAAAAVGAFIFSGIVTTVYGPGYRAGARILPVLVLAAVPWSVTAICLTQVRLRRDTFGTIAITITLGSTILIAALLLVPTHGINGAALAWLVGHTAASLVSLVRLWRPARRAVAEPTLLTPASVS